MPHKISETNIFDTIIRHKWRFVFQFAAVFTLLIILLMITGLMPAAFLPPADSNDGYVSPRTTENTPTDTYSGTQVTVSATDITRVVIPMIGVDAHIEHPQSQNVAVLDEALKHGAVYYPGSGTPAEGNVFIFGHSTNWAVVQNQAYKIFNGLEDLKRGDKITLQSAQAEFVYEVTSVRTVNDSEALVTFDSETPMLTLSTCNTFGEKQERHVVEATLVRVNSKL